MAGGGSITATTSETDLENVALSRKSGIYCQTALWKQ